MGSSFLAPRCPHCQMEVRLLSPDWQGQRQSRRKCCPYCGRAVELKFKAKTFAAWFALLMGSSYVLGKLLGVEVGAAMFVVAFLVPLLQSIYLDSAA